MGLITTSKDLGTRSIPMPIHVVQSFMATKSVFHTSGDMFCPHHPQKD